MPPTCNEPGLISQLELEDTTRGYSYNFHIYLPPCYEDEPDHYYPVLYLIPGRGGGPGSWFIAGVNKTADTLILNGEVPPFVIVTTENIDNDPYAETIVNELIPYVESHYRIQADRQHRAVAGGSLGGIAAYRIVFRFPEQFSSAAMFGSGLISGEETQAQAWLEEIPTEYRPRVLLNCGEGDVLMLERAQVMITLLQEAGIQPTTIFSEGEHEYSYWVSNFPAYFRWLAQEW